MNTRAILIARTVFHLPYFNAAMSSKCVDDTIHYSSHRIHRGAAHADYIVTYRPIAPIEHALPIDFPTGSLNVTTCIRSITASASFVAIFITRSGLCKQLSLRQLLIQWRFRIR